MKQVTKNIVYLTLSEGSWYFLTFLIFVMLARVFGVDGFGKFSFAFAFAAIVAMIIDFGINHVIIRDIARNQKKKEWLFTSAIKGRTLLSLCSIVGVLLIVLLINKETEVKYLILWLVVQSILFSFNTTFFAVYRAIGKYQYETVIKIANRIAIILALLAFVYIRKNIVDIGIAFCIGTSSILLSTLIINKGKWYKKERTSLKELYKKSWPFGLALILTALYYKNSTIILSYLGTDSVVGNYNAAFNILLLGLLLPSIMANAVYPLMAKQKETNQTEIKKYRRIMLFFAIGCILAALIGSNLIVKILYGEQFVMAATMLMILSFSTIFLFQNVFFGLLFTIRNKQQIVFKSTVLSTVINILTNIGLILINPLYGAPIAFIISEGISYIFYQNQLQKHI